MALTPAQKKTGRESSLINDDRRINQIEPWLGKEEGKAVSDYLDSGGWLTEFKRTEEFERMIADYVGSKYASVVSNGTVSLIVALMALGIGDGDDVIVPDYTMIASANAVVMAGATPVLVDINPTDLCLDLESTEKAITPRTRAIMFVSINGRPNDMSEVVQLAKKYGLHLIEDAAQSLGSRAHGKHLGTFGIVGSFSFSYPKVITTGQGGALVTDSEELYRIIEEVKDFGRPESGLDHYTRLGFNAKFTDLQAVIGIEQMKKLPWRVNRKREIYHLYHTLLSDIEEITFIETVLEDTSPWFIDILVEEEGTRDNLTQFLKERGIGTRPFYPAIHTQAHYTHLHGDFKNADTVSKRGLWLPSSSFLQDVDVERICREIRSYLQKEK